MDRKLKIEALLTYSKADPMADYLMAIALANFQELVNNTTSEEFAKAYGSTGTDALARYSEPK